VTGDVSDLGQAGATLTGTITPFGIQTTYYFEYGETTSYGLRVPANSGGVAGSGDVPRAVTRGITGLTAATGYHYRLVGVNSAGTTYGSDKSFTTDASDTAARAYEMVSPIEKEGVPVDTAFTGAAASPDGNSILYASGQTVFPGSESGPHFPRVIAHRSAGGWANTPTDLPLDMLNPARYLVFGTLTFSRDLGQGLVVSNRKLTSDAVEGGWNLYRRDPLGASPTADHLTLLGSDDRLSWLTSADLHIVLIGASADQRKLVFWNRDGAIYEASGGTIRPVSVLPDGTTVPASTAALYLDEPHQVSDDGSRIFFAANGGPAEGLYLRKNGTTTVPISVSHRPGDPATPVPARFAGATPDGRYVMFYTDTGVQGLTPDAPDGGNGSIYRYDVDTDTLTFVASDINSGAKLATLPATGEAYYQSNTNPTGAPGDGPFLLHAGGGPTTVVGVLGGDDPADPTINPRALFMGKTSPSGRYFAFVSRAPLTAYDNEGGAVCYALRVAESGGSTATSSRCNELYLYDSRTQHLTCPSCRTDGGRPTGDARFGQDVGGGSLLNHYYPRSVLDNGTVFFDTPEPLASADVNGTPDVYSWRNGRATLITRGSQATTSTFLDTTPDGSDVFFATDERLVGQDRDDTVDLYDARLAGGIATQSPTPGPARCSADECRDASRGLAAPDPPASQTGERRPVKPRRAAKAKVSVLRSSFTATTLTLTVQVSGSGRIRASGAAIRATSRTVSKAGTYTLKVPLTRKARAARKAGRRGKVAVKVSLTPPFAALTSTKLTRTLGK
jgi:hypothetical protein